MSIANILSLLGGVALFLFGITLMGDGLKKVAGNKLELVLYRLSGTPLKAVLLGTGVTAVIQSSSATSVMVVGFVNSGMMKLRQAVNVILGALIGTSITGWIICLSSIEGAGWVSLFSTSTITAVVAVIGITLRMFSKKQIHHHLGDILLGFAVLMYGMANMSDSVAPLKESEQFISMMTTFSNPVLGILAGAAFTAILQSASAAVGILQALSITGAMTFSTAYPIILGIAIGAAVPVLLSALGAKVNGRRAAFSYLIIEIMGVVICGSLYYLLAGFGVLNIGGWVMNTFSIAAVNSIFRIITAVVLFPFTGLLARGTSMLIKEEPDADEGENKELDRLDERFLQHPAVAIEQSRTVVNGMARMAMKNMVGAISLLKDFNEDGKRKIESREDRVDLYEDRLGTYLVKLNTHELTRSQNEAASEYLHTLSDFERISDHAINVCEAAAEIHDKKLHFSEGALHEIDVISSAITEILDLSVTAFHQDDIDKAYLVEPLEECIDILCDEMKLRHVDRLQQGTCSLSQGFIFNDLMTDFERVADHCSNIAVALIELHSDSFDTHDYIINLKELRSHDFDRHYEEFTRKYQI